MNTIQVSDNDWHLILVALRAHAGSQHDCATAITANKAFPEWEAVAVSIRTGADRASALADEIEGVDQG